MLQNYQYYVLKYCLVFLMISFPCEGSFQKTKECPKINCTEGFNFPSDVEIKECRTNFYKCQELARKYYPCNYIRQLINNGTIKPEWFKKTTKIMDNDVYPDNNQEVGDKSVISLCDSATVNDYCITGGITQEENAEGEFIYIVQQNLYVNKFYKQHIQITQCFNRPTETRNDRNYTYIPCKTHTGLLGTALESEFDRLFEFHCVEKLGFNFNESLVGLDRHGQVVHKSIEKPSWCRCEYKKKV